MKLTVDVINTAKIFLNPLGEREIDLRGLKIPLVENLGAINDQVDVIDFTDNEIQRLENFPKLMRLKWLLLSNNQIYRVSNELIESIPNLTTLVLANNRITSLSEIDKLAKFQNLQVLNLVDNPVCFKEHYRLYTIHKIPTLTILDHERIRQGERLNAVKLFEGASGKTLVKQVEAQKNALDKDQGGAGRVLSAEQKRILAKALTNATTQDQIDKIEKILRSGVIPDAEVFERIRHEVEGTKSKATGVVSAQEKSSDATKTKSQPAHINPNRKTTPESTTPVEAPESNSTLSITPSAETKENSNQGTATSKSADSNTTKAIAPNDVSVEKVQNEKLKEYMTPALKKPEETTTEETESKSSPSKPRKPRGRSSTKETTQMEVDGEPAATTQEITTEAAPSTTEKRTEANSIIDKDALTEWVNSLKVVELRSELKHREIPTTGVKDVLRNKLLEHVLEHGK